MNSIKRIILSCLIIVISGVYSNVSAQEESKENTIRVKKIKIVDGDTIITEKVYKKEENVEIDTEFDKEDLDRIKVKLMDEMEQLKIYIQDSLTDDIVNMKIDIDMDLENLLGEFDLGIDTVITEEGKTIIIKSKRSNKEHIHINKSGGKHKVIIFSDDDIETDENKKVVIKKHDDDVWVDENEGEIHVKDKIEDKKAKRSVFVEKADDRRNDYNLLVYPSFAKSSIYIEFNPEGKEAELLIKDDSKNIIHQESVKITKGTYSRKIDLTKMENGTYFVILIIEGEKYIRKVIAN